MAKYVYWYGIKGLRLIYHGDWADPEISYCGFKVNYWDIEDYAYQMFKEDHPGEEDNEELFAKYCRDHQKELKQYCLDY